MLVNAFLNFIQQEKLLESNSKVLLAISGGKDSVLMLHLFAQSEFSFGIAHCNFGLRDTESDADEAFIAELANKLGAPFYSTRFDTVSYAEENKLSIQMAARELRYNWFEKIRKEKNYDYLATAHHQNDATETVFINLLRGTGLAGLHGILPKRDAIIRPMLCFNSEEIAAMIQEFKLDYREDSSNQSVYYLRNKLRLEIIPELKKIQPDLENQIQQLIQEVRSTELILADYLAELKKQMVLVEEDCVKISMQKLKESQVGKNALGQLLKGFGFNYASINSIWGSINSNSGKRFFSASHELIKDRDFLIISEVKEKEVYRFENLFKAEITDIKNFKPDESQHKAVFDFNKLQFPLTVRTWQKGDYFYPLGMTKKKKLSDFFIDEKIPVSHKNKIPLVLSGQDIIWIAGYRIDNRYKITEQSEKMYTLELLIH